jgi:hypothetical protein
MLGGRLFDEGMYGCIFTPPLECKSKPITLSDIDENATEPSLSKIILKNAAETEFNISKVIRQIPLWKNYFIVSESICEPAPIQKDKELYDCPALEDRQLSQFRILTMPYGGVPLNIYRFNIKTLEFMDFIVHFIESVALLNLFGIVHRDIHQGNILIDKDEVPRIIDFNLAIPVQNKITAKKLKHQYNVITGQEPPDSTLVNAISLGYDSERTIDSIINKKPINKKIRNILNITTYEQKKELEKFYTISKAVKTGDTVKWFNVYWRTIDSWAVGVNIIDLLAKFSLWPEFSSKLKKISPKLFPVLKRLCAVNPMMRIDCIQALNYLAPNSFIVRKYGKAWIAKVGDGNIVTDISSI